MIKSEYLSLLSEPEIALVYTQRLKMTFTKKNWCTFGTVVACGTSDMNLFSEKVRTFRRVEDYAKTNAEAAHEIVHFQKNIGTKDARESSATNLETEAKMCSPNTRDRKDGSD